MFIKIVGKFCDEDIDNHNANVDDNFNDVNNEGYFNDDVDVDNNEDEDVVNGNINDDIDNDKWNEDVDDNIVVLFEEEEDDDDDVKVNFIQWITTLPNIFQCQFLWDLKNITYLEIEKKKMFKHHIWQNGKIAVLLWNITITSVKVKPASISQTCRLWMFFAKTITDNYS